MTILLKQCKDSHIVPDLLSDNTCFTTISQLSCEKWNPEINTLSDSSKAILFCGYWKPLSDETKSEEKQFDEWIKTGRRLVLFVIAWEQEKDLFPTKCLPS